MDLKSAEEAVQDANKSAYEIQGAVSNISCQIDDSVLTAVETLRLRVDHIYNLSVTSPSSAAGDVHSRYQTMHPQNPPLAQVDDPLGSTYGRPNPNNNLCWR